MVIGVTQRGAFRTIVVRKRHSMHCVESSPTRHPAPARHDAMASLMPATVRKVMSATQKYQSGVR